MKRIILLFFAGVVLSSAAYAADEKFVDCGAGFIVANAKSRDGIPAVECKKLWCRDLENGKSMGKENTPSAGYQSTAAPVEICDNANNCIECFGTRKWCATETPGNFEPEFGIHVRPGGGGG